MKSIILSFTLLISLGIGILRGQAISNIAPAERTDGTMIVDILYDLSGPDPAYDISVEVSFDNGANYAVIDSISGDIGAGINTGGGKHIVWDFGSEFPGQYTSQAKIKLTLFPSVFQCGSQFTDARDGQSYTTVQIGTQCWMAENMNIGTMISGTTDQTNNSIIERYCYDNNTSNCDVYGGLYQWNEMMQYVTTPGAQGICPTGWHLPTDAEWCTLEQFVDATISCGTTGWRGVDGGGKLKEEGTTHWYAPNSGASNSSGFTALPGGYVYTGGSFVDLHVYCHLWSSSENGTNAWNRDLNYNNAQVDRYSRSKADGVSARCLKDIAPPSWSCGQPLPVTHSAGDIAPVNKSVNYGTVETNLTGSNKCWITQNLGSDHQAVSATDNTEESAGWYWQFNRKQGYKHDGTTRTPGTAWINPINENSDWLPANDPCTLLLGTGWRLPTGSEWTNADVNGGWNSHNQTYASVLKVHSTGYINGSGNLADRGISGNYWSSSQNGSLYGWYLDFGSGNCNIDGSAPKGGGFGGRCLKDISPATWSCGQSLPVYHSVGDIAPVNKVVDYGTVETNLTGSNKCWITQNLGSDRQALSATDNTEESAGWYWQFNRKQGYKHDGTTRTPNTTWVYPINENIDWQSANDPCTLLLGSGWRLPTYTEWFDADANGGWNNLDQTFASVLKLHASGIISASDGSLNSRGTEGTSWSSSQVSGLTDAGWLLSYHSGTSYMGHGQKYYGITARCLKD